MNNQNLNNQQQAQGQQSFNKPTTGLFSLPPSVMNLVP